MRWRLGLGLFALLVAGALLWWKTQIPLVPPVPPVEPPPANAPVSRPAPATQGTVYFARELGTGWALVAVPRTMDPTPKALLEALLAGPTPDERKAGLAATLPQGTRLRGVTREGSMITVDFSRELQANFRGGAEWEEVVLFAIVNTLTGVKGVETVRLLVEGAPVESIGGHLAADQPLRRNPEILARGSQP